MRYDSVNMLASNGIPSDMIVISKDLRAGTMKGASWDCADYMLALAGESVKN